MEVGRHIPPRAASLPAFLERLDQVYGPTRSWERTLIATACAHHRVAWVHPFLDGNGRATRLQSHCALWKLSEGLWSPNRGLARSTTAYYAALQNADSARRGDLDGRGNLSAAGLFEWVKYFLGICQDQVTYMSSMLALEGIKQRIEALIIFRSTQDKSIRREAILPLVHIFGLGPITRGEFAQMTGLGGAQCPLPVVQAIGRPTAGQRHALWPCALWHAAELAGHGIPESLPGSGPATGLIFLLQPYLGMHFTRLKATPKYAEIMVRRGVA